MKILLVDDEARRMRPVMDEMEFAGHDVVLQTSVDLALAMLGDQHLQFDALVIDISMPSGSTFHSKDTDGGARTGVYFYEALRRIRPKIKVVVFTNVADQAVEQRFKSEDQSLCLFVRKPSVLPFEFVEQIEQFVFPEGCHP